MNSQNKTESTITSPDVGDKLIFSSSLKGIRSQLQNEIVADGDMPIEECEIDMLFSKHSILERLGYCKNTLGAIYKTIENTRIHRYLKEKFDKPIGHISKNQLQHEMNQFFDMTSYPHKSVFVGNLNFTEAADNPDAQLARFGAWYVSIEEVQDAERGDYVKTTISYFGEEHIFGNQDFNPDFDIRLFKDLALSDMILFCQIQETVEAFEMLLNEQPENEMVSDWYEDWIDDLSDREKLLHGLLWANE